MTKYPHKLPNGFRYRVIKWPTLADQLDAFYRRRHMVLGSRSEDES